MGKGANQSIPLAGIPRDLRPLARKALRAGWTIRASTGGHLLWQATNGELVRTSASPSDTNVLRQVVRTLRRRGLVID